MFNRLGTIRRWYEHQSGNLGHGWCDHAHRNHAPRLALAERIGVDYREMARLIFDSEKSLRAQLGEIPARTFWDAAGARYSLSYEEFITEFFKGDIIDQELIQSIRKLRRRYKTGLLSNAF